MQRDPPTRGNKMTLTTINGTPASGGERLCGEGRTIGSIYVECGSIWGRIPLENFLVDPVIPIDPIQFTFSNLGVTPWIDDQGVTHLIDIVGESHYPSIADFIEEGKKMGFSRKVQKNLPWSSLTPQSQIIFLHKKAHIINHTDYTAIPLNCPKNIHQAGDDCIGYHWNSHFTPAPNLLRSLGVNGEYRVTPSPVNQPTPKLQMGMFLKLPITNLTVINTPDSNEATDTLQTIRNSSIPSSISDD